ncbi:MAG: hypothetical protein QXS74_07785 [Nitrososphaeria archaeon]
MEMREKIIKGIILQIIKSAISFLVLSWIIMPGGLANQFLGLDLELHHLLPSVTILLLIFCFSSIVQNIFAIPIAKILGNALNALAFTLAFYLFNLTPLAPEILSSINLLLFVFILTAILSYVAKSLASIYHEPLIGIFSISILLPFAGIFFSHVSKILISSFLLPSSIPGIVFWSFIIASIINFHVALFRYFPNPYLHHLGIKVSSNIIIIIFFLILIQTYFSFLRPSIISNVYLPIPINLIEWGALCIVFFFFYEDLKIQVRKHLTESLNLGSWTTLKQEIQYHTDIEQLNIANLIKEFIECGIRDGLITNLTLFMFLNGFEENYIRNIIKKILDFQEIPYPKIRLNLWLKGIDNENKIRRRELVKELLNDINNYQKNKEKGYKVITKTKISPKREGPSILGGW